jgi:hypothetical protein
MHCADQTYSLHLLYLSIFEKEEEENTHPTKHSPPNLSHVLLVKPVSGFVDAKQWKDSAALRQPG